MTKPKPAPPTITITMTTKEVADILHVYPKKVIRLYQAGKLAGRQLPGGRNQTYVFELASVVEYAAGLPGFDADELEGLRALAENRLIPVVAPPKRKKQPGQPAS